MSEVTRAFIAGEYAVFPAVLVRPKVQGLRTLLRDYASGWYSDVTGTAAQHRDDAAWWFSDWCALWNVPGPTLLTGSDWENWVSRRMNHEVLLAGFVQRWPDRHLAACLRLGLTARDAAAVPRSADGLRSLETLLAFQDVS